MDLPAQIGRYSIIRLLGQGGMGRVVLAKDSVLGRHVAIKTLRDDLGLPPDVRASLLERMRNEAKAAAALSHPSMVTLHDMGEDPAAGLFLVFEYVEGPTLRERLADGAVASLEVAKMAKDLGSALTQAHEAGVIHRDVKPENVILSKTGAKLTDFGIARIPGSSLTRAGALMGTPAYSAPEALANGEFSAASDQFSLAATLYEALSGNRAFGGDDALATASLVANAEVALLSEGEPDWQRRLVMRRVDGVLARGLAKDKTQRYMTCSALGDALAAAIDARVSGAYSTLPPTHSTSGVPSATRRWQNVIAAGGLAVIIVLLVLGRQQREDDNDKSLASASASAARPTPPPHPRPRVTQPDASVPDASPQIDAPIP